MHQQPLFLPESPWRMPDEYPDLSAAKKLFVDIEARDPFLREKGPGYVRGDAQMIGFSICTDDLEFCKYFPMRHAEGPNLPVGTTLAWFRKQMSRANQTKVGANIIYDVEGMWYDGVEVEGPIEDVQIAEPLLDEESLTGYSLDVLAKKYLGVGKEEALLEEAAFMYREGKRDKDWKKQMKSRMHMFPAKFVGPYAEMDAMRTGQVHEKQVPLLEKEGLMKVYDVECRLIPLLLAMRIKGIPFDVEAAARKSKEWRVREAKLLDKIMKIVGRSVDPWTPSEMKRVYDHYDVAISQTSKGNPSFENDAMENLGFRGNPKRHDGGRKTILEKAEESDYPAIQYCVAYRKLNKMRRDFVDGYQEIVVDGKIHGQFHPLRKDEDGTRSGRLSSSHPNLQQVPHRDPEFGPEVRSLFVPEKGLIWVKRDYSQQEPRLTIHYAHLRRMPGSDQAWQQFRDDPFTDYHQLTADMAGIARSHAKTLNLCLSYGGGKKKIAAMLGMSDQESEELFKKYHGRLPYMKLLSSECEQCAQRRGYIRTLLGRRRHFSFFEPDVPFDRNRPRFKAYPHEKAVEMYSGQRLKRSETRVAMNALIQGSAADLTKMVMVVEFEQYGEVPYAQVHDELDSGMESLDHAVKMRDVMENAMPEITVKMVAEVEVGSNWGYTTKLEDERRLHASK